MAGELTLLAIAQIVANEGETQKPRAWPVLDTDFDIARAVVLRIADWLDAIAPDMEAADEMPMQFQAIEAGKVIALHIAADALRALAETEARALRAIPSPKATR